MQYYTKDWYNLMQRQHYTSNLTPVPDRIYTDKDIQSFYQQDLDAFVKQEKAVYEEPPSMEWAEDLLRPEKFYPEMFYFTDKITGEHFHPQTPEIARIYLQKELDEYLEQFHRRPPFDLQGEIQCFRECYQNKLHHSWKRYPLWAQELLDRRLLALDRVPQPIYDRLKAEEEVNRAAFAAIEEEAGSVLAAQDIPARIRDTFHFHDSVLLYLNKRGKNRELTMNTYSCEKTPYVKVIFHEVTSFYREPGLILRTGINRDGELTSHCHYLYDELYKTTEGYEVHMLISTRHGQKYLTIGCADITVENNLPLCKED